MADFPYTKVTGKLQVFFKKIQEIGVPPSASTAWLPVIGFGSNNDRTIIKVAKFIGFIDSSNKPTSRWRSYRDHSKAKGIMAEGIKEGYKELFDLYPDAYQRSDVELKNFFRSQSSEGDQVITSMVATFKALCSLADFSESNISDEQAEIQVLNPESKPTHSAPIITTSREMPSGITININIELSLPPTTEKDVYDNLFAALKKHILSGENDSVN